MYIKFPFVLRQNKKKSEKGNIPTRLHKISVKLHKKLVGALLSKVRAVELGARGKKD